LKQSLSYATLNHGLNDPARIVIADDHAIFRTGLRLALEADEAIASVHEAASFEEMLTNLERGDISLLILDLRIPGLTVPDGLRLLRQRFASLPVLILSASSDAQDMITCLGAGASGYVTKASDIQILFNAIRLVRAGGVFVPADIVAGKGEGIGGLMERPVSIAPRLTRRQSQVLALALDGHANKEIAYRLQMSEGTVKTHLAAVMRIYDVNNRVQLLRQVERIGFRH
jgi:two-component system nitrate/nitrite response regulator NarL